MDDIWKYGMLGGGLSELNPALGPVTANRGMLAQADRARHIPRTQLEGYQAAQMAGMVPGLGMLGVAGDVQQYMEKPETRGILNYGLTALGAVPFLGALAKMAGPLPRGVLRGQAGAISGGEDFNKIAQRNAAKPVSEGGAWVAAR